MKTINEIFTIEPRLKELSREARALKATGDYRTHEELWYRYLKPKMIKFVGFLAEKEELKTTTDYDTVYNHFIRTLGL